VADEVALAQQEVPAEGLQVLEQAVLVLEQVQNAQRRLSVDFVQS
jgi:hypothetical protein